MPGIGSWQDEKISPAWTDFLARLSVETAVEGEGAAAVKK